MHIKHPCFFSLIQSYPVYASKDSENVDLNFKFY
jgi:hypothetical protein